VKAVVTAQEELGRFPFLTVEQSRQVARNAMKEKP
jgi:hypothetical protein